MRLLFIIVFLLFLTNVRANNYYISSLSGDDSRTPTQAQSPATPWKSLDKLNAYFSNINPGDSILLKRGEFFKGAINVTKSGTASLPIVIAGYGTGTKPVINGFTALLNWNSLGNGVWESSSYVLGNTVNLVTINGVMQPIGRYPNKNTTNGGYLTLESHSGNTQITDNELSSNINWTGGEIVIRKNRWIIDRNLITEHTGNTINYIPGSGYGPTNNYGYFIQNHPATLDLPGEWCFEPSTRKLKVYFGSSTPNLYQVNGSYIDNLITIHNQNYIVINGIKLIGSNIAAVDFYNTKSISIINTDIDFSGTNAINGSNASNLNFNNIFVSNTNNDAVVLQNCSNSSIKSSKIHNTGMMPGMGKSGDDSYQAIIIRGNNNLVEFNNIDSTGYIPIRFEGDSVTIKNNIINYFTLIKDDGGGIYTWKGTSNNIPNYGRKIIGNIVLNGQGAGAGTGTTSGSLNGHGIYIDDNSDNVDIVGNSVANCSESGIFIHNSQKIKIQNNIVFNNPIQLQMIHDGIAPEVPIRNIVMKNNVFFSKHINQSVLNFVSLQDDFAYFGAFENNFYCRPLDDNFVISTSIVRPGLYSTTVYDLLRWKSFYNYDSKSKTTPLQIAPYTINNIIGVNKFDNGSFAKDINGAYGWSTNGGGSISWDNPKKLDEGSIKIDYQTQQGTKNNVIVNLNLTPVSAGKNYLIKFSMIGAANNKVLEVCLRKTLTPYSTISDKKYFSIETNRTEHEFVLSCNSFESSPSIIFEISQPNGAVWIDNISVYEANVTYTNPDDNIIFEYNPTIFDKTLSLPGTYIDLKNRAYSNEVTLAPYSSTILLKANSNQPKPLSKPGKSEINYIQYKSTLSVYPNPVIDQEVNIEVANLLKGNYFIRLINSLGQVELNRRISHIGGLFKSNLQLPCVQNGVYVLELKGERLSFSKTIICD